jgi:hypothetical protein
MLIVFNTCGLGGRENPQKYVEHIKSILNQKVDFDFTLAVSACMNSPECIAYLRKELPIVCVNDIQEKLPVSVTFNHTVETFEKEMGPFEEHMFVDSGLVFTQPDDLQNLYDLHKSGDFAMTAARTDDDMGFDDWFRSSVRGDELFAEGHMIVPVGKAVNLHAQIFHREVRDTYGKVLPDIFAGQCMESTFSFLCAAIKKRWVVHKDVVLKHLTGMDGPSAGFSPAAWQSTGKPRWDHLFHTNESILTIISRGIFYGMGYEENQGIVVHSKKCFTDGICNNDNLAGYIADNLYLKDYDYDKIKASLRTN